ncbi:sirohydrochlorin cobaltochelatase [Negativicoccus succinicivorans]|uniref:sirohydrochlorin cobaltochelatase n=1 Tax=Negativicoccus succinicivorans TaxID=620903 RepID=UPI003703B18C
MNKQWKRFMAATFCAAILTGFGSFGVNAAYELSDEVKQPTPALLTATEIGVKVRENTIMQQMQNKDAILITSFGTTFKDTRAKTIDAVVNKIKQAFPHKEVRVAFTSHIIIDRIMKNEGIQYYTPEQAFDNLKKDGYNRIAIVPFNIIPGIEYDYSVEAANLQQKNFKKLSVATPIMYYMGQEEQPDQVNDFINALKYQLPQHMQKNEAVLLMAHGTPHPGNAFYAVIQDRLEMMDMNNVYVYSVEGRPSLDDVIPHLHANKIQKVTLMPIMMVAGDHANNDMAGDEEDSHKMILQGEGFKVNTYIRGLGENPKIQDMFVERAREAVAALDTKEAKVPYTPMHSKKH